MPSHFAGTQRAIHSNMILALLRSEEKEETEQACFSFYYFFFYETVGRGGEVGFEPQT